MGFKNTVIMWSVLWEIFIKQTPFKEDILYKVVMNVMNQFKTIIIIIITIISKKTDKR